MLVLIEIKTREGGGSAFRPAREASMMRALVERHRGRLPLDTVESIWRVIISTFTYIQAPYSVHVDAMMKLFSCSPLIFLVCRETFALPQPKQISG
jgi:hypothetical protein